MTLAAQWQPGKRPDLPCLVWLHGFLGSAGEWQSLRADFSDWPQLWVDLPGHGASAACAVTGFANMSAQLAATLRHYSVSAFWLIGYSLGGRIASYYASQSPPGLQGLVVEGGHPGLPDETGREARCLSDAAWARRLRSEPLATVLADWYQQPVFHSLSAAQRADLVAVRSRNNPRALALMLEATSLGRQPDLRPALHVLRVPFYYLCGEYDTRFQTLAAEAGFPYQIITTAGHNAHRENPAAFARQLTTILLQSDEENR